MVSKEEHSAEERAAQSAAAQRAAQAAAGGLRNVRYGEAPVTHGGASEPAMVGFEGAPFSGASLDALVTLLSKGQVPEPVITEKDIAGVAASITGTCLAAGVEISEVERIIKTLRSNVGAKRDHLGDICRDALKEANALASDTRASKQETPAQKTAREIAKLKEEIKELLNPHMSEEEKKKDEEFRRKIATATDAERTELEKAHAAWLKKTAEGWTEHGTKEQKEAGRVALPKVEELIEKLKGRDIEQHKTLNSIRKSSVEPSEMAAESSMFGNMVVSRNQHDAVKEATASLQHTVQKDGADTLVAPTVQKPARIAQAESSTITL